MLEAPKKFINGFYIVLRGSLSEFVNDNTIQLSASLSFYTLFAIAPVLIIMISLAGTFYGTEAVQGKIYGQINGLVGEGAAIQIQEIIKNVQITDRGSVGAVIGAIILLIGATGVFTEIQYSVNYIWDIKAKPKKGWLKYLSNRLLSFSLVISLGFILLISLIINAFLDLLSDRLSLYFANTSVYIFHILNWAVIFVVVTCLFATIFKVLPDAVIKWRDALVGACFTSVLFLIGKYLISIYLTNSRVSVTYGAAASLVIILLWVYYSSNILFLGAEFTKIYTVSYGSGIVPYDNAVFIIKQESKEINIPTVKL
ncbi:MAG: YihY/virulence factor BrkB family protein [Bacteroidota bacterium]